MISTITTTTVTTVTTVTSMAATNPLGAFTLVSSLALVGFLCTKEILGTKRGVADRISGFLYVGLIPLSISFAILTVLKILSVAKL